MKVISDSLKAQVRDEVEAIASNSRANLSLRQAELLRYLVEEEIAGRGENLKAYKIAVEALGKPDDFDASSDSSVRSEMYRLRQRLKLYRLGRRETSKREVRIVFQTGSYQPVFRFSKSKQKAATSETVDTQTGRLPTTLNPKTLWRIVLLTSILGIISAATFFTSKNYLANNACELRKPTIFVTNSSDDSQANIKLIVEDFNQAINLYRLVQLQTQAQKGCESDLIYHLTFTPFSFNDTQFINAVLVKPHREKEVWSRKFELPEQQTVDTTEQVAISIALSIAKDQGFIPNDALSANWSSNQYKSEYECIMNTHRYFRNGINGAGKEKPIVCLEAITSSGDALSTTWALQAAWYSLKQYDDWLTPEERKDSVFWKAEYLEMAISSLEKAEELNPFEPEAWIVQIRLARLDRARSRGYSSFKKIESLLVFAEEYLDKHVRVMRQVANSYAFYIGDWDKALTLEHRANKIGGPSFEINNLTSLRTLLDRDIEKAAYDIERFLQPGFGSLEHVMILVITFETDKDQSRVERVKKSLVKLGHTDPDRIRADVIARGFYPELENRLVSAIDYAYQTE